LREEFSVTHPQQIPHPSEFHATPDSGVEKTLRVLDRIFGSPEERRFDIRLWDGSLCHSVSSDCADFALVVAKRGGLRRMLLPPSELSIAEAFIRGDIDIEGNLESAMSIGDSVASRIQSFGGLTRLIPLVLALPSSDESEAERLRRRSTRLRLLTPGARKGGADVIQFHYDVGNDFYSLWLDPRMMYTCAYFKNSTDDLETAQLSKVEHICRKLRLAPGERLLDIGCGWGGLIIHAAKNYGVHAVGITLSEAQAELARERIASARLSDKCEVRLQDYRDLPPDERFDKIVSVGMMEHVAERLQPEYFSIAFRALRPGGLFLNHFIVSNLTARKTGGIRAELMRKLWRRDEFIDKYVFPDGRLVALGSPILSGEAAGFETRDVESLREHYAKTLRWWLRGLDRRKSDAQRIVGEKTYRVWKLYMTAAANAFSTGAINVVQCLLSKTGPSGESGVPLTRDDIYRAASSV
jgi:cyclopropane-fatty-acyl-phospholipid synthase